MQVLTPPAPVQPVKTENAGQMVQIDLAILLDLDDQAEQFINDTLTLERHDPVFKERIESIHRLGNSDILNSAAMSNRMLDRPVKLLNNGLFNDKSVIGKSLLDLRRKIDDLNPATQGDLFKPRKILGLIPFGNKVEDYFNKYRSAQSHINGILEGLEESKDELLRDNAAIEQEKTELWKSMQRVEQYVYIGKKLDE